MLFRSATPTLFVCLSIFTVYSLIQLHYLFTLYSFYTLLQTTAKTPSKQTQTYVRIFADILVILFMYCIHTCKAYLVYAPVYIYSLFTPYSNIIRSLCATLFTVTDYTKNHPLHKHKHMYVYLQIYW